jgi:hypothetical protein
VCCSSIARNVTERDSRTCGGTPKVRVVRRARSAPRARLFHGDDVDDAAALPRSPSLDRREFAFVAAWGAGSVI